MKVTFISDEASQELEDVIKLATQFGLDAVELRSLHGKRVFESSVNDAARLREHLDEAGISVCCLDTPIYKCEASFELNGELKKLDDAVRTATVLGTRNIRLFSFWRGSDGDAAHSKMVANALDMAHRAVHGAGLRLLVENGKRTTHRTGYDLASLLDSVCTECFGVVWDPGNSLLGESDEDPIANGYTAIAGRVNHIHLKDPKVLPDGSRQYVRLGEGDLRIKDQISILAEHHYTGYISLETHWRPGKTISSDLLDAPYGHEFSANGYEATRESLGALLAIISAAC